MYKKSIFNLAVEFGPIIAFLLCAEIYDFFFATKVFVVLTVVALFAAYYDRKKIAFFPLFVSLLVVVTGLLTIIFTDPNFVIIETSIYNAICAIAAIVSIYIKKPVLKLLFNDSFDITEIGWRILTKRWAYMFVILTISNEIVRIFLSVDAWVDYKSFATLVTAIFGFYQITLTKKHRTETANPLGLRT